MSLGKANVYSSVLNITVLDISHDNASVFELDHIVTEDICN